MSEPTAGFRRFVLERDLDETGISGTGRVVEGVQFSDGHCAYRWCTGSVTGQYADSIEIIRAVHGHGGKTRVVWLDPADAAAVQVLAQELP